ncbi:MAG: RecX family transcriptional regulator [bacterium]
MPTITRLVQGKKNQSRVNLYLDGQFAFALGIDEVGKRGLKKGLELTTEQVNTLVATDEDNKVYAKILNFLSFRPRTIKEVRDRLIRYDVKDPIKQYALINRLKNRGYLDDLAFARWFIESRNTHKLRSPRMLELELKRHGVGDDTISQVISTVTAPEDTIYRLLSKKLGTKHTLTTQERQKIYAYFSRQGFVWEKIREVVKKWESE